MGQMELQYAVLIEAHPTRYGILPSVFYKYISEGSISFFLKTASLRFILRSSGRHQRLSPLSYDAIFYARSRV